MTITELSLGVNNLYITSLFPPRESLVSDILGAGDWNMEKLFYGVYRKGKDDLFAYKSTEEADYQNHEHVQGLVQRQHLVHHSDGFLHVYTDYVY
jgi:hypothetical protein